MFECLEVQVACLAEIHFHAIDDSQQMIDRQLEGFDVRLERTRHWVTRLALGHASDLATPPDQCGACDLRVAAFVDHVIYFAAESI
jgi:hypothetical protein